MTPADSITTELRKFLELRKIPFKNDEPLAPYTTFRLGGPADCFVTPENPEQLAVVQGWLKTHGATPLLLGGGSNLLIADSGIRGVVVHPMLGEDFQVLQKTPDRLRIFVPASARAPLTGKQVSALGFTGLEFLATIPGQFGGSVIQNAGCYGHELKDSLISAEIAQAGNIATLKNADCRFSYRDSMFKNDSSLWVTGATLELKAGDPSAIEACLVDYKAKRIASQPKNRRSAGSIFKNPSAKASDKKAWQLINAVGLRGVRHGDAEISAAHCNFIVNNGNATASDVYWLMRLIEEQVYEDTGVKLEREVVLAGDFHASS